MKETDKQYQNVCSINFSSKNGYILQKVINKTNQKMYVLIDSNNPKDEIYSCYELDLGNMLEYLIKTVESECE